MNKKLTRSTQTPLSYHQQKSILSWCAELMANGDKAAADQLFLDYWEERRTDGRQSS